MTASDSAGSQTSQPAARILGPATPKNCASGSIRRSASINAAPSVSPDASPATSPTRSGAGMVDPMSYRTRLRELRLMKSTNGRISGWESAVRSSSSRAACSLRRDR